MAVGGMAVGVSAGHVAKCIQGNGSHTVTWWVIEELDLLVMEEAKFLLVALMVHYLLSAPASQAYMEQVFFQFVVT